MGTEWSTTENSIKWCQTCLKWFDMSSNSTIMTLHFGRKGSVIAQTLNMNSTSYKLVPSRSSRLASKFLMTHLGVDQKQWVNTHEALNVLETMNINEVIGNGILSCLLFAQNYTITEKSKLKDIVNSLKACRLPCKDQQKWQNENYIDLFPSDPNLPIEQQFFYFAKERFRVFQWWQPELSLWDFIVHLHHS